MEWEECCFASCDKLYSMPLGRASGVPSEDEFLLQIIVIFYLEVGVGTWSICMFHLPLFFKRWSFFWVYRVITNPLSRNFPLQRVHEFIAYFLMPCLFCGGWTVHVVVYTPSKSCNRCVQVFWDMRLCWLWDGHRPIHLHQEKWIFSIHDDRHVGDYNSMLHRIQEVLKPSTTLWEPQIAQDVVYFVPQLIIVYMIVSQYAPELLL